MLDVGALDRNKPQFWLQDHLAGFLPGTVAAAAQPDAEKPLIPPDELFKN
jgi:hypothetical protein